MLKALGQQLMGLKEEFYAESFATGATRADGWVDIEGGIGTLLSYASKARRELPNARVLTDGDVELLSKDGSFSAQHILTPLEGVAVHINAFNFPVWGMLEKIAPTLIAGVPCDREAGEPDRLPDRARRAPHRRVRHPARRRAAADLRLGRRPARPRHRPGRRHLHRLGLDRPQAASSHPAIVENSTRFTMEADSLNAAILGPDAGPGTPEFDLFVREVAREMTVKAGQKCTAIRRVIAPRAFTDALVAALGDRLAQDRPRRPGRRGDPHGPARQPRPAQGGPRAHPRARRRGRDRRRRPRRRDASPPATPRRAPSSTRSSSTATRPLERRRHPRRRGLRPGLHRHALRRPRRGDRARQARQGLASSPRSSPTTRRSPRRPSSASPRSTAAC